MEAVEAAKARLASAGAVAAICGAVTAAWYGLFKTGKPEYFAASMQAAKA